MSLFGYGVQFLLSGVLPVFQNLSYNLHKILSDVLSIQQVTNRLYRDALAYAAVLYQVFHYSIVQLLRWRSEEVPWRDCLDTTKLTA